ncbi:MAG: hypothetical protein KBF71_08190 [Alphaproteobacteria bacterium]|nr:hypothetical protein [Alphaproteobacteria bacterium]
MSYENCVYDNEFAYVVLAIRRGSITIDEFITWVYLMIERHQNLPTYFFDLSDVKISSDIYQIMRDKFPNILPDDGLTDKESEVFWGIAFRRRPDLDEDAIPITKKTALKRLEQYPHVVERFKKTFPFIKLDF